VPAQPRRADPCSLPGRAPRAVFQRLADVARCWGTLAVITAMQRTAALAPSANCRHGAANRKA
jgi:hypothetical protein